jgi:hypothetical protein
MAAVETHNEIMKIMKEIIKRDRLSGLAGRSLKLSDKLSTELAKQQVSESELCQMCDGIT